MSTVQTRPGRTPPAPPLDSETEMKVLEALIFVSDEPITLEQIGQVVPGRSAEELRGLVEELSVAMQDAHRGLRIEEVAGGFRFSTRPELAPWIRTYFRNRNRARLSPASIETLAVVAYKQPITGPEIQEIRGVDPQGSIKTLLEKRLIRIGGKKKVVGRPFLYKTTRQFLMHFGLAGIEDLPPIEDFERLAGEYTSVSSLETDAQTPPADEPLNGHPNESPGTGPQGEWDIEADDTGSSRRVPTRPARAGSEGEGDDTGDDDDDEEEDEDEDDTNTNGDEE